MDLAALILAERSKAYVQYLAEEVIGEDQEALAKLWELVRSGTPPIPRRAVWVLELCDANHPQLCTPYLPEFAAQLEKPGHQAIHRHLAKILARHPIPGELQGTLYDLCLRWLISGDEPVASKVHCMEIALSIARGNADLEAELAFVLNDQMEFNSAAFKARAKKVLRKLTS